MKKNNDKQKQNKNINMKKKMCIRKKSNVTQSCYTEATPNHTFHTVTRYTVMLHRRYTQSHVPHSHTLHSHVTQKIHTVTRTTHSHVTQSCYTEDTASNTHLRPTRLLTISYAVFCLNKKQQHQPLLFLHFLLYIPTF